MLCSKGKPIGCTTPKPFRPNRESRSIDLGGVGLGGGTGGPSELVGLENGASMVSSSIFRFWRLALSFLGAIGLRYPESVAGQSNK